MTFERLKPLLEPITNENLKDLNSGDWIWDNKMISRRKHQRSLNCEYIQEPMGFRIIHILDLEDYPRWSSKPFCLSDIDSAFGAYSWTYFEEGRFYKLKEIKNEM